MMTALEMVNMRKARAAVRVEIEVLRRERLAYEQESIQTRKILTRSEAYIRALEALVDQGIAVAMAKAEASRVRNGYDSNGSGPRLAQAVRECTYPDFLKCQPLNFKGIEGVVGLTQSRFYMVELPCKDCYSGSCLGIAMEDFEENDDRQVLPKGRNQEARN
nr:hypothetical protein [Tanacetum cinerariifolium]